MGVLSRQNHQKLYNVKDDQFVYTVSVATTYTTVVNFGVKIFAQDPKF
jgi:hypothetical protein